MATPHEIRNKRLLNDLKEMESMTCSAILWTAEGSPPCKYIITYNIRSIIDVNKSTGRPIYSDTHKIGIDIPAGYPFSGESLVAKMYDGNKPIFHPNFWPGGLICIWGGNSTKWNPGESVALLVFRIAKLLQFDPDLTQESHQANPEARVWYISNKESGLFPTDNQIIPFPGEKTDEKGDFVIS